MNGESTETRIISEIRDIHVFFERWFRGELPETREAFSRVERALGPEFQMIPPGGQLIERGPLIDSLWNAHASTQDRFEIEVRNVRVPRSIAPSRTGESKSYLAVYEEWQWRGEQRTARLSSAWLDETSDGSWTWRHVHETWMPGFSASS